MQNVLFCDMVCVCETCALSSAFALQYAKEVINGNKIKWLPKGKSTQESLPATMPKMSSSMEIFIYHKFIFKPPD